MDKLIETFLQNNKRFLSLMNKYTFILSVCNDNQVINIHFMHGYIEVLSREIKNNTPI